MLREPKLAVFYSPPKHDLRLKTEDENRQTDEEEEPPPDWPDRGSSRDVIATSEVNVYDIVLNIWLFVL